MAARDRFYSWRNRIVFVSNVPFHYKAQDLLLMFRQFGRCFRVDLARNHQDGRSRGFCYVEFEKQDSAQIAVTYLDNAEVDGRYLRAELAQFPPDELVHIYKVTARERAKKDRQSPGEDEAPPSPQLPAAQELKAAIVKPPAEKAQKKEKRRKRARSPSSSSYSSYSYSSYGSYGYSYSYSDSSYSGSYSS